MAVQCPYPNHIGDPQAGEIPVDGCVQRANAGFLAPGQTKISVCYDAISTTGNDFLPLPTPPTGKVWIITDIQLSHDQASAQRMALQFGGISEVALPVHGSAAPDILNALETQPDCPGGIQPSLLIIGAASMHTYANFFGIQQNIGAG